MQKKNNDKKVRFGKVAKKDWKKMRGDTDGDRSFGDSKSRHEGDFWVQPVESGSMRMSLGFQVADVKKPLISVQRIVEKGNHVAFGPGDRDNYILNKDTGDKMILRPNGNGSYLMDVNFVGGGKTEITVDSGRRRVFAHGNGDRSLGFVLRSGG